MSSSHNSDDSTMKETASKKRRSTVSTMSVSSSMHDLRLSGAPTCPRKGALTVLARHKVLPGREADLEAWVRDIVEVQKKYEGYLGAEVIRPTCLQQSNEYVSIFRYDTYDNLQKWMNSKDRTDRIEKAREFEEGPIEISYHSLEYLFLPHEAQPNVKPPSRHKMAFVTFLVIWLQVHFIPVNMNKIPKVPDLLLEALTTALIVVLTTYLVMPIVTKYILHWWLFPGQTSQVELRGTESEDRVDDSNVEVLQAAGDLETGDNGKP